MKKRFTDADKWDDPWFRGLGTRWREAYLYLCDRCDAAGVWLVDIERMRFDLGDDSLDEKTVKAMLGDRVQVIDSGRRWYLTRFIAFQYPNGLSPDAKPHRPIIALLNRYGIEPRANSIHTVSTVLGTVQDKEKEKDKETDKDSNARDPGELFAAAPRAPLRVVQNIRPPVSDLDYLRHAGAIIGSAEAGAWQLLVDEHGVARATDAVCRTVANGTKPFRSEVAKLLGSKPSIPKPPRVEVIDGIAYTRTD